MRIFAKVLALLWGGWWTFFGIACGLGEGSPALEILIHALLPGLILLGSALAALKWERIGGAVLLIEGLIVVVAYPLMMRVTVATMIFVLATMALPPIISGLILVRRRIAPVAEDQST